MKNGWLKSIGLNWIMSVTILPLICLVEHDRAVGVETIFLALFTGCEDEVEEVASTSSDYVCAESVYQAKALRTRCCKVSMSMSDHLPIPQLPASNANFDHGNDAIQTQESSANLQVDLGSSLIYHWATSMYRAHSAKPSTAYASGENSTLSTHPVDSDTNFESVAEHFGIGPHDDLVHYALMQFFQWQYPHITFNYREAFLRHHFSDRVRCRYWSSAVLLSLCTLETLKSPEKRHRESSAQSFSAAKSILMVSDLTKPSTVTFRSFLCLAYYEIGRGNLFKGWGFSDTFS